MKELFKLINDYIKARKQYMADLKTLKNFDLSMEALQRIVDLVRLGEAEVTITVNLANGNSLVIERKGDGNGFKTFREKWAEARAARMAMENSQK